MSGRGFHFPPSYSLCVVVGRVMDVVAFAASVGAEGGAAAGSDTDTNTDTPTDPAPGPLSGTSEAAPEEEDACV